MNKFLTQVKGFTPLIEVMVQEVGLVQAAVYGVVWRYCQLDDGVCRAAHETLAKALGLSRGTVQRHIKELCDAEYLRDTTPGRKNRPHVYADTGRAQIVGLVEARVTVSEKDSTVSEKDTPLYQKSTRRKSDSIEEKRHVASDAPPPTEKPLSKEEVIAEGNAELDSFGIQRAPLRAATDTPHWREQANAKSAQWGLESEEFQRQLIRYGTRGRLVQDLGYELEARFGLRPNWKKPNKVRGWTAGLADCLEIAEDNILLILKTARKMREDGLTIANPYSLHKTLEAAMAENRSSSGMGW